MTLRGSGHGAQSTSTTPRSSPAQPSLSIQPTTNLHRVKPTMHGCSGSHCRTDHGLPKAPMEYVSLAWSVASVRDCIWGLIQAGTWYEYLCFPGHNFHIKDGLWNCRVPAVCWTGTQGPL